MRYGQWRGPLPAGTYMSGRIGTPVVAVVIHRMLGTLTGTDSWFRSGRQGQTSTHFGVGFVSSTDVAADRPSVYQWVDTFDTAWGWYAVPNDTPTAAARDALGAFLGRTPDMNRPVIHIEVANWGAKPDNLADWYTQPWTPNLTKAVDALIGALVQHYGALWLLGHADLSTKLCPGSATPWMALGGHGVKRGTVRTIPDTSTEAEPVQLRFVPEVWGIKQGAGGWIAYPPVGQPDTIYKAGTARTVAEDGEWVQGKWVSGMNRLLSNGYWAKRSDLDPRVPGGDPDYIAAVMAAINGKTPEPDAALQAALDAANQRSANIKQAGDAAFQRVDALIDQERAKLRTL